MFGYKELDRAMSYIEGSYVYSYWLANVVKRECLFKLFKTYVRTMIRHLNHIQLGLAYEGES